MTQGYFGEKGELFFEINLIAIDGSVITVDALLDTGFTDWIAMNIQDVESLGWSFVKKEKMQTAWGNASFNVYQGTVSFGSQVLTLPVLGGKTLTAVLIGISWLENLRLVVDRKLGLLTLEEE